MPRNRGYGRQCHCTDRCGRVTTQVLTGLALVVGIVFLGIIALGTNEDAATSRFGIRAAGDQCVVDGDVNATVIGKVALNSNSKTVEWNLLTAEIGAILSIYIEGPLNATNPLEGPPAIVLCGGLSSLACDLTSPVEGAIQDEHWDGSGLRELILPVQEDAPFYYLIVRTADHPDCAVRAPLNSVF